MPMSNHDNNSPVLPFEFWEWLTDLFNIAFHPNNDTFQKVLSHGTNNNFFSILWMAISCVIQYAVYICISPTRFLKSFELFYYVFWPIITVIIICFVFSTLIRNGFQSMIPSLDSILYISSLLFAIYMIMITISFSIYLLFIGPNLSFNPMNLPIGCAYLLITIFGIIYLLILCFLCARAALPKELWDGILFVILWAFADILSTNISQFLDLNYLGKLEYNHWQLLFICQWVLFGFLWGLSQSIVLKIMNQSNKRWLLLTCCGSIIGSILYCLIIQMSVNSEILAWQIQINNYYHQIFLFSNTIQKSPLNSIFSLFWSEFAHIAFFLPIGIIQSLTIKNKRVTPLLWIGMITFLGAIFQIKSSDFLFLFSRWFLSGVIITYIIYGKVETSPKL